VFTARYALSPYIKQIRFVFKGLILYRIRKTDYMLRLISNKKNWDVNINLGNKKRHVEYTSPRMEIPL
jgi:hypothetical protein